MIAFALLQITYFQNTYAQNSMPEAKEHFLKFNNVSGDYAYIFGKKDTTLGGFRYPLPYLARVLESVEEPWQFYAGPDKWSYNCKDAIPVGNRPMSESFFVYEKNNRFYLIMHEIWMVGELYILEDGKILISFNVRDVFENVESYRARFLRVPIKLITDENTRKFNFRRSDNRNLPDRM